MSKPRFGRIWQRTKKLPDGTVKTLPTYWIKYYRNGQPFRESSHSTKYADAERLLKKRLGEVVTGKFAGLGPERIRMAELFEAVIEDYAINEKRTLYDTKLRLDRHLVPAFGELRAADFTTQHVKRYTTARRASGAANATINRELSIVRRAFSLAAAADPPKVARAPHIPKLDENNVREGFLEYDQYLALRGALMAHLRCLFVVGYHVGSRSGELRSIRPEQVDLAGKEIRLEGTQTKNKKPRTLPIYGEMEVWLRWQLEEREQNWPNCPWLFHYQGRRIGKHLKGWKKACEKAGLPGLLFHDLRRSAVRNMIRAGIPEKVAMEISGHKTRAVFERYNIISQRDLKLAAEKMERYFGSLGTLAGTLADGKAVN